MTTVKQHGQDKTASELRGLSFRRLSESGLGGADALASAMLMASVALSSEVGSRCQAAGVPVVLFNRS